MHTVTDRDGEIATVELADLTAPSHAFVAPGRGGMVTRLVVGGRDVLYLDPATLGDPAKNVRGGNPVLFPSPGKLAGDAWSRDGRRGVMLQHGFARNLGWDVVGRAASGAASVTLRLESSDATRARYPWDFTAELTYALRGAVLRIEQRFTNRSDTPMPFGAGFHPYFLVPDADKRTARVPTTASRAFDNAARREIALPSGGIDLTAREVDLHLLDHGRASAELLRPGAPTVRLSGSPEYTRWVVWTLAGKDFVCLEPWTCPGDALNTGEGLLVLSPGESRALWLEIAVG